MAEDPIERHGFAGLTTFQSPLPLSARHGRLEVFDPFRW